MSKFIVTFCISIFWVGSGHGQTNLHVPVSGFFIDSSGEMSINEIINQPFEKTEGRKKRIDLSNVQVWLKIDSINKHLQVEFFQDIYPKSFFIGLPFKSQIYSIPRNKIVDPSYQPDEIKGYRLTPSTSEDLIYFIRIYTNTKVPVLKFGSILLRPTSTRSPFSSLLLTSVLVILLFFSMSIFIQYLLNKDKNFLLYFFYLITTACLFYFLDFAAEYKIIEKKLSYSIAFPLFPISFGTYLLFIYSFLELPKFSPIAAKLIKMIIFATAFTFVLLLFPKEHQQYMNILTAAGILCFPFFFFSFYYVYKLWIKYDWGAKYVLLGSAVLFASWLIPFIANLIFTFEIFKLQDNFIVKLLTEDLKFNKNLYLAKISLLIEITLFSTALAYREQKNKIKKSQAVSKLLKNRLIAQKKESDLQLKVVTAEQKALRAQMNPHFMSNCLNSIKGLIQQQSNDKAEEYLIKFSELIRGVVQYSQETGISLDKEIAFCKLYVEMESLRFRDPFAFEIEVVDDIDTSFYTIPPFILQPLLENAIWHGLSLKKGEKRLKLLVFSRADTICCVIDDNGVGLNNSKKTESNKTFLKKSVGIKNTKERLLLFKKLHGIEISLDIIDKTNSTEQSEGVMAIFSLSE